MQESPGNTSAELHSAELDKGRPFVFRAVCYARPVWATRPGWKGLGPFLEKVGFHTRRGLLC